MAFKFLCDKAIVLVLSPLVLLTGLILLVLNPFLNPGPLLFAQHRMGMGGKRFTMWKFRTMSESPGGHRAHDAALEEHRIKAFGCVLRKFRIDELPNLFNVFLGEMSLVGPRPDIWDHSAHYLHNVSHYADRFRVRPGVTGLAQVRGGYADSTRAVERKARYDAFYVRKSRIRLDLYILWLTLAVVLTGSGGR